VADDADQIDAAALAELLFYRVEGRAAHLPRLQELAAEAVDGGLVRRHLGGRIAGGYGIDQRRRGQSRLESVFVRRVPFVLRVPEALLRAMWTCL
jgi:hypothetical protein